MIKGKTKRILSFVTALSFLVGIMSTPVYASTKLTDTVKKAYVSTLETRTEWGDMRDICTDNVDYEEVYKDYYKALDAYEESSSEAYYGMVYTISSKSSKNSSTVYGKPVDSIEYSVVGGTDIDGEKDVTVYKCKTTTWLKKISGEYKITKVTRKIIALDDYENDITDEGIATQIADMRESFLENNQLADEAANDNITSTVGAIETELPHKDAIANSGNGEWSKGIALTTGTNTFEAPAPVIKVDNYVRTASADVVTVKGSVRGSTGATPAVYVNGEAAVVDTAGKWTKQLNLTVGDNIIVIKAVDSVGKEAEITKRLRYIPKN